MDPPGRTRLTAPGQRWCRHFAAGFRIELGAVDGRDMQRLDAAGTRIDETASTTPGTEVIVAEVVAGPDCRPPIPIRAGRWVIGRDPGCDIRIDDDTVAAFHAMAELRPITGEASSSPDWSIEVLALVGGRPTQLDGDPVVTASGPAARRLLGAGVDVIVGSSSVRIGPAPAAPGELDGSELSQLVPDGEGRYVVHRRFAVGPDDPPLAVRTPEEPSAVPGPPATGLVAAIVGMVGALVVSHVVGSMVMAVFAAVTAAASAAMWAGSWIRVVRSRRRQRRAWRCDLDRFERDLRAAADRFGRVERRRTPGVVAPLRAVSTATAVGAAGVWVRRASPQPSVEPCLRAAIGRGRCRWPTPLVAHDGRSPGASETPDVFDGVARVREVSDVPITIDLGAGRALALTGARRRAVARSIVVQLAWSHGPSDWQLTVVTDEPHAWAWATDLPHARRGRSLVDVADRHDPGAVADRLAGTFTDEAFADAPMSLVLVDLTTGDPRIDAALRSVLGAHEVATLVVAAEAPGWVDEVACVARSGGLDHRRSDGGDGGVTDVEGSASGISAATAASVARLLGRLIDPEFTDAGSVPDRCGFVETQLTASGESHAEITGEVVAGWWDASGVDPPPVAWLGVDRSGPTSIDLLADGPHALLAGTTGSGKSELLRTLVLGLAVRSRPADLAFVLVDYKGGAAFDACTGLPHVLGSITDLDDGLAARALLGLEAELRRRSEQLRHAGASDLAGYRAVSGPAVEPLPRLVVVVDEFATLAKEFPAFLASLVDVAQRGRSLGVHLVLATQRPAGVLSDDIRANTALRIALRTEDAGDSRDVIGVDAAAQLPRSLPGRALRRGDGGTLAEFQVASTAGPSGDGGGVSELEQVVAAVVEASRRAPSVTGRAPWLPALPTAIAPDRLSAELSVGPPVEIDRGVEGAGGDDVTTPPVGVVDDPARQRRHPLRWRVGDGSLLLVGAVGSGTTSTLMALGAAAVVGTDPDRVHLAVIDAHGDRRLEVFDSLAHSLGAVRATDQERLRRLLDRLVRRSDEHARARRNRTVLLIDGLDALWQQLLVPEPGTDGELAVSLRQIVVRGDDLGIDVVATARGGPLPTGFAARETWVGALDDTAAARTAGWRGAPVTRGAPGRFGIVSTGRVAQVALGAPGLASLPLRSETSSGPSVVTRLPARVSMRELAANGRRPIDAAGRSGADEPDGVIPVGLDAELLVPIGPRLGPGDHLLVIGRPGAGVTTTLHAIRSAWRARRSSGVVIDVVGEDSLELMERAITSESSQHEVLVVVDDAHRLGDDHGRLGTVLDTGDRTRAPARQTARCVTVVAGVRLDAFRGAYGHWTRTIAAAEHGIALTTTGPPPTEVFGVAPPQRPVVAGRPGLAWLVDGGRCRSMQIATVDEPDGGESGWPAR